VDATASFEERDTMERQLQERRPKVVLLGNSVVEKDVDLEALAQGLGVPSSSVVRLVVPLSRMPVWYAILSHVVAPAASRPDVLLVLGTLEGMVEAPGAGEAEQLWEWMKLARTQPETGLVAGGTDWEVARGRAALLRKNGLEALKELSVGLVFPSASADGIRAAGRAVADPALQALFEDEGARDLDQRRRVVPVVEPTRQAGGGSEQGESIQAQLIRDFLAVAARADIPVVFVRVPVSPERKSVKAVDLPVEYWLRDRLVQHHAGWIDLQDLGLGPEHFTGVVHLDEYGRERFTDALTDALKKMGLGSDEQWSLTAPPRGLRRSP